MNIRRLFLTLAAAAVASAPLQAQGGGFDLRSLTLPPGFPKVSNVAFIMEDGGSFTATGITTMRGQKALVLASVIPSGRGRPDFIFAIKPENWSLTEAIPALANPVLDQLTLSHVALVLSDQDLTIPSSQLPDEAYDFYREVYQQDSFTLRLTPGINLISAIPVDKLPPDHPLIGVMDALGIEKGTVLLQGTLGKSLALLGGGGGAADAIKDILLRAELPPMHPTGSPDWFVSGQLALELTGQPSVKLVGEMNVLIQEDQLQFFLAAALARTGVSLSGGMIAVRPWVAPFGIGWLTMNKVVLQIGISPTGSVQLGFAGDAVIGKKDIDVAVALAISPAGVPTNFIMKGESESGVGLPDLVELQQKMAAARDAVNAAAGAPPSEVPSIPLDALPNIEFRSLGLQFAPKPAPDLGVERGMKLKGRMWLPLGSDGSMTDFAGVDVGVTEDGLWAKGDLGAFTVGPLVWQDAKLDLTMTRETQHLIVNGEAELLSAHSAVDLTLSRTALEFHTVAELYGLFHATLDASAAFNLRNPSFVVDGVAESDFSGYVQPILREGIGRFATRGQQIVEQTSAALEQVNQALALTSATAEQLRNTLVAQRANAERAWQAAQAQADQARQSAAAAKSSMDAARRSWDATPTRELTLKAQRRAAYLRWIPIYAARSAAYAGLRAAADASRRVLDVLPPVDQNVLLLKADEAVAQLRGRLETAKADLERLQARFQLMLDVAASGVDPMAIERAEVHAGLDGLLRGEAANWRITGTFVGTPFDLRRSLDFSDPAQAVSEMLTGLIQQ
jgi:hypothetical protein